MSVAEAVLITTANPKHFADPEWAMTKTCNHCKLTLSYPMFYRNRADTKTGRLGHCKSCDNKIKKNRDPRKIRVYKLQQKYNMSTERHAAILAAQEGRCAICRTDSPDGRGTWHVDHDHSCCPVKGESCGKCVRGLLCHRCNTGLGLLGDDAETLTRAATYLTSNAMEFTHA